MRIVLFEVTFKDGCKEQYLKLAAELKRRLTDNCGIISSERFVRVSNQNKLLSLSFWEDETCIEKWRYDIEHRFCQQKGRDALFESYKITVADPVRTYTADERNEAPLAPND